MLINIKLRTDLCIACALDSLSQAAESLHSHDIPDSSWCQVGIDILFHNSKDYLILVDYYWPELRLTLYECELLKNLRSATAIRICKRTFARYDSPHQVHSDNASQFTTAEFKRFSLRWQFVHTTLSPGHQQSNGKAKATVKIMKRMLKRAKITLTSPFLNIEIPLPQAWLLYLSKTCLGNPLALSFSLALIAGPTVCCCRRSDENKLFSKHTIGHLVIWLVSTLAAQFS